MAKKKKKNIKARGALYNLLTAVDNEMLICYLVSLF